MAVAEMSKLNLVAMAYDRDAVLNALHATGATEIKQHTQTANTVVLKCDGEALSEKLARYESALEILCNAADGYFKENKIKTDILQDGFSVSYSQFMSADKLGEEAEICVDKVFALTDRIRGLNAELARLNKNEQAARAYSELNKPLSEFADTACVRVKLGTVPAANVELLNGGELFASEVLNISGDTALVMCAAHKSCPDVSEILQSANFIPCPFRDERAGKLIYGEIVKEIDDTEKAVSDSRSELYGLSTEIKKLKIYCDYMRFELEKLRLSEKMRATEVTVLMEAYVPKEAEKLVSDAVESAAGAVYYEFSEPLDSEIPPTLYKNNKVVKNFETITNMYSPVNSREFDPNGIMAFFYSLFLGFIMGDIGYGLIMLIGGGFIYFKQKRDCGLKRLSGVFAMGGIFAIIWGVLFNSAFGISLPMYTVIPDAQKDMWIVAGRIKVPAVLIISLMIGVVQLFAGYICRTVQCWRRGQLLDGVLDGLVWAVFSVGVGLAIVGFIDEANMSQLSLIGGLIAGGSLLIAVLTAGRKEKLLGKFTKGFGAAYGVINYASDILSYARLYGLMLSGAVIAQIVSTYGVQFITGGNAAFIILGVLLMVVGHGFNLAIGLLGAYIHDARLQYVEFYGRFYEGEGELFKPLGSNQKFIYIEK